MQVDQKYGCVLKKYLKLITLMCSMCSTCSHLFHHLCFQSVKKIMVSMFVKSCDMFASQFILKYINVYTCINNFHSCTEVQSIDLMFLESCMYLSRQGKYCRTTKHIDESSLQGRYGCRRRHLRSGASLAWP